MQKKIIGFSKLLILHDYNEIIRASDKFYYSIRLKLSFTGKKIYSI